MCESSHQNMKNLVNFFSSLPQNRYTLIRQRCSRPSLRPLATQALTLPNGLSASIDVPGELRSVRERGFDDEDDSTLQAAPGAPERGVHVFHTGQQEIAPSSIATAEEQRRRTTGVDVT